MLAIAQSGHTYHYLHWIPSERGPLVTDYGSLEKEAEDQDHLDNYYREVLEELFSKVKNGEPICTFSIDRENVLISSCFAEEMNSTLIDWHMNQTRDEHLFEKMDYYHFPFSASTGNVLNMGIPKILRQSFQFSMRLLKSRMNGIGVGIFSAEEGARQWFHADSLQRYMIWKVGKKKMDEILLVENNELTVYCSFHRVGKKWKLNWNYGDPSETESILSELENKLGGDHSEFSIADTVFLYTSEGNMNEVKQIHSYGIGNVQLLNPLLVLENTKEEKINEFATLPLAETGNAFGGVDV
ncbi:MAG: hypothetical protein QGF36_03580 [Candidatus Marinimicrobia bacterium]|jgi:hypothetical protein|nr:hypothetical protein [Candidatus Neomarinimicrobiota bacterium]MDP6853131.1 hypothetical protein [Candidatus Neomarinimicrobiota bacterium]MDP6936495.1 hypothetical protein [Candidatus Neomarinimicrobiota bacterium]